MNMKLVITLLLALLLAYTFAEEIAGGITYLDSHSAIAIKVRKALLDEINRARKDCRKEQLHELNVVNIQEEVVSGMLYIVRFRIGDVDATAQLIDRPNAFHSLTSEEQTWEASYFLRAMFTSGNKAIHPCDFSPHQHEVSNTPDKEAVRALNSDQSQTWHATIYGRTFSYGALPLQNGTVNEGHQTLLVEESAIPTFFDLRQDPASRSCIALNVEDQGSCAACYAFAATHNLALRHCKQTKGVQNYEFSEQWIMCESGRGCDGGWYHSATTLADQKGLVLDYTYPYTAKKQCPGLKDTTWAFKTASHTCLPTLEWLSGASPDLIKFALASREKLMQQEIMNGGVYVAFEITDKFSSYRGGIFTCGANDRYMKAYHAVIAVGWGQEVVNGQVVKYWIMKNSWGSGWGEHGFFRIRRGTNDCGIESMSVCFGTLTPHVLTCANGNAKQCQHGGQLVRSSCACKCNDRTEGANCEKCKPCVNYGTPMPENNCQCKCPQGLFDSCYRGSVITGTCLDNGSLMVTFQAVGFGPNDVAYLAYGDAPFMPEVADAKAKILYTYSPGNTAATITVPWSLLQNRSVVLFSVHSLGVNEFGYPRGWSVSPTGRVVRFSNKCQNVLPIAF